MKSPVTPLMIEAGLLQRLVAVEPLLLEERSGVAGAIGSLERDASTLLDGLVRVVRRAPTPAKVWLLCCAVSGALPTHDDVVTAVRFLRTASTIDATLWLLDYGLIARTTPSTAHLDFQIVSDGVVVDVNHSALHDLHTGIQQVVRNLLPLWARDHHIVPVAWTECAKAMRTLTPLESGRVFHWGNHRSTGDASPVSPVVVVPWRSVVVLAEVPTPAACDRLTALARFSDNEVVAIGYDCIPAVSPDMMPEGETERFARYLPLIKRVRRLATIGTTATTEFQGFASALSVQGLSGPTISEVRLPVPKPTAQTHDSTETPLRKGVPMVLCVGTFEPRKNHLAVLYASERLWREGIDFELLLIGSAGWGTKVKAGVTRLQLEGRSVRMLVEATNTDVDEAYRRARFTVFASLHEGFGLPVAESLEHGTPVVTSNFGSTLDVASGGGALLIDPHDDEELVAAMRRLLTDDELIERLRQDITARSGRTWEDYASELWENLVGRRNLASDRQEAAAS